MARLLYIANVSLDGYTEDEQGDFQWTEPADDVFAFITDLIRPLGTHLLGRRMYETMAVWETDPSLAAQSPLMADFANVWRDAEKVVHSMTLTAASTATTRLESSFEAESVRGMKASATHDMSVGGPNLAAHAFEAGLVDECQFFVYPLAVGGGKRALPRHVRIELELLDERRFSNGVVNLRYRTAR
ncbi:MAG TPA: dihydrofolate reductase family protein [Acidimicrobiia bacterium]|nr:dihydrofolate reductase family protein [Acidimicrobiia bacterium]